MLFQALSAKLGIVTGRNLAELSREHFPRPVVWGMWAVSEIAAMATDLAEFLGGATIIELGAWSFLPASHGPLSPATTRAHSYAGVRGHGIAEFAQEFIGQ